MISPDLPIRNITEDKLNRGLFVHSLATAIIDYSSAALLMVIGHLLHLN